MRFNDLRIADVATQLLQSVEDISPILILASMRC
jgi:hypothetical protein